MGGGGRKISRMFISMMIPALSGTNGTIKLLYGVNIT